MAQRKGVGMIVRTIGDGPSGSLTSRNLHCKDFFVKQLMVGGSAANAAAIWLGDVLVAVDGTKVQGCTIDAVQDLILGPEGTTVLLALVTQSPTGRVRYSQVGILANKCVVAVCCSSVLQQCVAVCCRVLQCQTLSPTWGMRYSQVEIRVLLQSVVEVCCCSVVAVCCCKLPYDVVYVIYIMCRRRVGLCYSQVEIRVLLQCVVAVCCSMFLCTSCTSFVADRRVLLLAGEFLIPVT